MNELYLSFLQKCMTRNCLVKFEITKEHAKNCKNAVCEYCERDVPCPCLPFLHLFACPVTHSQEIVVEPPSECKKDDCQNRPDDQRQPASK
jgi:hypothetical protein